MKQNPQNSSLYSQQVDTDLAAIVLRIEGKDDSFGTDFLGTPGEKSPACVRLEAWKNPLNNLWQVDRYSRVPGTDFVKKEIELNPGLCFFDALHYCARFQRVEEELGKRPVHEDWQDEITSYRTAAENAGQVIDQNGDVHPCAFGRVLTEGFFDKNTLTFARKTKDEAITKAAPSVMLSTVLMDDLFKNNFAPNEKHDLTEFSIKKRELANDLHTAMSAGDNLLEVMSDAVKNHYQNGYKRAFDDPFPMIAKTFSFIAEPVTGGFHFVKHLRGKTDRYSATRPYDVAKTAFQRAAMNLPDCLEKSIAQDFLHAANFAFHLEHAAAVYDLCAQEKKPGSAIQAGLPYVEEAAKVKGLNDTETSRLKAEYLQGNMKPGHYLNLVRYAWGKEVKEYKDCGDIVVQGNPDGLYFKLMGRISNLEENRPF